MDFCTACYFYRNVQKISGEFYNTYTANLELIRKAFIQTVYLKRWLRGWGIDIKFDWPAEMIHVRISWRTLMGKQCKELKAPGNPYSDSKAQG
jgi:hypothetical protein